MDRSRREVECGGGRYVAWQLSVVSSVASQKVAPKHSQIVEEGPCEQGGFGLSLVCPDLTGSHA